MATEKRLIDANALIKNRDIQIVIGAGDNICIDIADIAKAPTVDAVEVVHGRWTTRTVANWLYEEVCSVCGFCGCEEFSYCPNCGAKMDGGKDK